MNNVIRGNSRYEITFAYFVSTRKVPSLYNNFNWGFTVIYIYIYIYIGIYIYIYIYTGIYAYIYIYIHIYSQVKHLLRVTIGDSSLKMK